MPTGKNDPILRNLYRIDVRHARILLLIVLTVLAVVGCDGDNGGGY